MKKTLKIFLIYVPLALIVLIIALFFLLTSNFGLTRIVAPIAGKALGMPIEAERAELKLIHPYIELEHLTVGDKSAPFIKAGKLSCSLNLNDLLFHNTVKINSILISNTIVTMHEDAKGTWNASFMNSSASPASHPPEPAKPSTPMQIDISDATLQNISYQYSDNAGFSFSVSDFNFSSPLVKNDALSKIKTSGKLHLISGNNVNINSADLSADIKINLDQDYIPQDLDLDMLINSFDGKLKGKDLSDKNSRITASINHIDKTINISNISLQSFSNGKITTTLTLSGAASFNPLKINLKAEANPIGNDTINLITNTFYSIDLGSAVSLKMNAGLTLSDNKIVSNGSLLLSDAAIEVSGASSQNKCLFSEDLTFDAKADLTNKTALVNAFELNSALNGKNLAKVFIKKPLVLDWGGEKFSTGTELPELYFTTDKLDLLLVKPLLGENIDLRGQLTSNIMAQIDIKNMNFLTSGQIKLSNASFSKEKLHFDKLSVTQNIDAAVQNLNKIIIKNFNTTISQNSKPVSSFSLSGYYYLREEKGNLTLEIPEINPAITGVLSPDFIPADQAALIKKILPALAPSLSTKIAFTMEDNNKTLNISSFSTSMKLAGSSLISLALNSPLIMNLAGEKELFANDININASVKDFNLSKANLFMPADSSMKFNNGNINVKSNTSIDRSSYNINSVIQLDAKKMDVSSGQQRYNDIDLSIRSSVALANSEASLKLSAIDATILFAGKDAVKLNGNSFISLKDSKNMQVSASFATNETLLNALHIKGSDYQKIGRFNLNGKLTFLSTPSELTADASLNLPAFVIYNPQNPSISKEINGTIDFSMLKNAKELLLKTAKLSIMDKKELVANLNSSGKIIFNSNVQSTLNVSSDKIDLYKLMSIYSTVSSGQPANSSNTAKASGGEPALQQKEPAPMDLNGINLQSKIDLNNIVYGPLIKSNFNALLTVKDNQITLDPAKLNINNSDAKLFFYMNPSFSDGYTYEVKANLQNLDLDPFIRTFVEGNYSNTKGTLSLFDSQVDGKGFTESNLAAYFKGYLVLNCNDISLPYDITQNRIMALIILPIKIISGLIQYMPNAQIPDSLSQATAITNKILSQKSNINFQTGQVKLTASNGTVRVNKFDFRGGSNDMIKYITGTGTIGFNSSLALVTNTNLSGVDIPLSINGTIDSPSPNIPLFITQFITKNAVNLLNNTNVREIINNPQGVSDALNKGAQNLMNNLFGGH